jgi:uncharacterized protein (DUF1778 family)
MTHVEKQEKARFDGALPLEQKQRFEYAAELGGFRTLTDFVFSSAEEKADEIITRHETLLSSEKDKEIFFAALLNPPKPNKKLQAAAKRYKEALGK